MCVSCAWATPVQTHLLRFFENGVKVTAWKITSRRADGAFVSDYALHKLKKRTDHDLKELAAGSFYVPACGHSPGRHGSGIFRTRMVILFPLSHRDRGSDTPFCKTASRTCQS